MRFSENKGLQTIKFLPIYQIKILVYVKSNEVNWHVTFMAQQCCCQK